MQCYAMFTEKNSLLARLKARWPECIGVCALARFSLAQFKNISFLLGIVELGSHVESELLWRYCCLSCSARF